MTYLNDITIGRKEKEGYFLTWGEVAEILGHEHKGSSTDDEALIEYLVQRTQHPSDLFGEGIIDEAGWYITIK